MICNLGNRSIDVFHQPFRTFDGEYSSVQTKTKFLQLSNSVVPTRHFCQTSIFSCLLTRAWRDTLFSTSTARRTVVITFFSNTTTSNLKRVNDNHEHTYTLCIVFVYNTFLNRQPITSVYKTRLFHLSIPSSKEQSILAVWNRNFDLLFVFFEEYIWQ